MATLIALLTVLSPVSAAVGDTEIVSRSGSGLQGTAPSFAAAVSKDGQFVAFLSDAPNLVPGDTNATADVFLRDRTAGTTSRVNVSSSGAQTSGTLAAVAVSGDGRYVAFTSSASTLVGGDTNGLTDTFVRDTVEGRTSRISVSSTGAQAYSASQVSISEDGRFVAFVSHSPLLVAGTTLEVLVHDRLTGSTLSASRPPAGGPNGPSESPDLSPDGRFVAFESSATNLIGGVAVGSRHIYLRDMSTGQIVMASVSSEEVAGNQTNGLPSVSDQGRYVAFISESTNLVTGDTNGDPDIFVRDTQDGTTTRASVATGGAQGNASLSVRQRPSISRSGRYVTFASTATGLVPDDTSVADVFLRDTQANVTSKVSKTAAGLTGNNFSHFPVISGDGRFVAFQSGANNLVPSDTNGTTDVFIKQVSGNESPPTVSYALTPPVPDGTDGWYRAEVGLAWTVADGDSPTERNGCVDQTILIDQAPTTYSCTATNQAGTAGPVTVTIGRDGTPPVLDASVTPGQPDGANGWYRTAPTVSYTCFDATSGVRGCPDPSVVGEGAAMTATAAVLDMAGNRTDHVAGPFEVDLTDPEVTCPEPPDVLVDSAAQLQAVVTDEVSGPVDNLISRGLDTSAIGTHVVTMTGTDKAGRTTDTGCGYNVRYGFTGFFQPVDMTAVNVAKAGSAVPLKWRVENALGAPVSTLTSVDMTSTKHNCDGGADEDPLEEVAAGGSGLQNLGNGYYQLNWKTPKNYAGTCRTLHLDLGDGDNQSAEFRFKS